MTCSVAQAFKDRWAAAASSFGIFDLPSTDGADNRFYQDGLAPAMPSLPYAVLKDTGGGLTSNDNTTSFDSRPLQLQFYAGSRDSVIQLMSAARKLFDCDIVNWHPTTDEGDVLAVKISRGASNRQADDRWIGVLSLAVRVSVSRS